MEKQPENSDSGTLVPGEGQLTAGERKHGSHKKWRALIKRQRRKERRQAEARAREAQEALAVQVPKSPDTLAREALEERQKRVKEEYEEKLRESQHLHWLDRERRAQEQFRLQQERQAREKQRREEEQKKIREEWEKRQKEEEEVKEEAEKKKQRQDELLKEATKHEKKPGESPWHNPLAPEVRPGIERDPCPFFLKVGACRFGDRCSRGHQYPESSTTLLFPGMYSHFKLEHSLKDEYDTDLGLEYEESETYQHFREFFHDTLPEFQKYGRVVQFKVCCNEELHLRGNVYVQFADEESALQAFAHLNGRWYGGRQLSCQLCVVERWRHAICGVFAKNRCPKGRNCNFIHAFRNPGNMFWEADRDLPVNDRFSSRRSHRDRRSRSRSPGRTSSRLTRRSRSPESRRSRSHRSSSRLSSKSQRNRSISPRRRSRSPRKRRSSRSRSRSRSPRKRRSSRSRSRSRSPSRRSSSRRKSRSPSYRSSSSRKRSRSPRKRSQSPKTRRSRSKTEEGLLRISRDSSYSPEVDYERSSKRHHSRSSKRTQLSSKGEKSRSSVNSLKSPSSSPERQTQRDMSKHNTDSRKDSPELKTKDKDKQTNISKSKEDQVRISDEAILSASGLFCETPEYVEVDTTPEYALSPDWLGAEISEQDSLQHTAWEEGEGAAHTDVDKETHLADTGAYPRQSPSPELKSGEKSDNRRHKKRKYRSHSVSEDTDSSSSEGSKKQYRTRRKEKKSKKKHKKYMKGNDSGSECKPQHSSHSHRSEKSSIIGLKDDTNKLEPSDNVRSGTASVSTDIREKSSEKPKKKVKKLSFRVKKLSEATNVTGHKKVPAIFQAGSDSDTEETKNCRNSPDSGNNNSQVRNVASIDSQCSLHLPKNSSDDSEQCINGQASNCRSKSETKLSQLMDKMPEKEVCDSNIISHLKNKDKALEFLDNVIANITKT